MYRFIRNSQKPARLFFPDPGKTPHLFKEITEQKKTDDFTQSYIIRKNERKTSCLRYAPRGAPKRGTFKKKGEKRYHAPDCHSADIYHEPRRPRRGAPAADRGQKKQRE
jgi:hypothetical protein